MRKSERKVATTVYLTTDQRKRLKDFSAVTGVPVASLIRQGVTLVLSRDPHQIFGTY